MLRLPEILKGEDFKMKSTSVVQIRQTLVARRDKYKKFAEHPREYLSIDNVVQREIYLALVNELDELIKQLDYVETKHITESPFEDEDVLALGLSGAFGTGE